MRVAIPSLLLSLVLTAAACGGMDHGDADAPPAAPTGLSAAPLSGGAHLTWTDNADNEEHYMVQRQEMGVDADFKTLNTLPFDAVSYHDAVLTSGKTYLFKVVAMNAAGEAASNVVMLTAP